MSITVSLRTVRSQDMDVLAGMVNDWIDATDWLPRVQSHAEVVKHYQNEVMSARRTFVAVGNDAVLGFINLSKDGFVTAHHVAKASRNQGIGGLLLERAKREMSPRMNLYVFEANERALSFYTRHGFVEVNRTTGDNDEDLPDVLLEWQE